MKAVIYLSVFLWGLEHMVSASNKNFRAIWSFYYFFVLLVLIMFTASEII